MYLTMDVVSKAGKNTIVRIQNIFSMWKYIQGVVFTLRGLAWRARTGDAPIHLLLLILQARVSCEAMNKPPSLLSLFAALAALAIFGFFGARYMLSSHSASTQEQLRLVWPGIAALPEPERAFLTELALTCNVVKREPVRAEVIDCLRSVPMNQAATGRLEGLLKQAPPPAGKP